jgi:hypothetical protein
MQAKQRATLGACAVLAAALAGCSGDDEGGSGNGDNMFGNADPNGNRPDLSEGVNAGTGPTGDGCADGIARTSRVTPRVILVVDGSCSMSTDYPASGESAKQCTNNQGSRWAALRDALVGDNGVVRQLENIVEFGLVVYGTQPECPLTSDPIEPGLGNFGEIDDVLGNTPPGMFTPTGVALDWVYENLIEGDEADSELGPEIVILATDGEPNSCGEATTNYQPSVDALNKGTGLGVTTYVISLANAEGEFHNHLQELANIGGGGNAQLYEPTTPQQLSDNLMSLVGGAVNCDVALNGRITPGEECEGTVRLNGEELECNGDDGWSIIDSRHIRLEGEACDQLMSTASGNVEAFFPCGVFMVD